MHAAQATGEFRAGIARLLAAPDPHPLLAPYLAAVAASDGGGARYPGSPLIAQALARDQDRLILVEAHPEEVAALKRLTTTDRRFEVHHRDGYEALVGLVPPPARRGLVLIDPPFEAPGEFDRVLKAVTGAQARFPQAVYAVWYPIKGRGEINRFLGDLAQRGLPPVLVCELTIAQPSADRRGLTGCGLAIINPPYRLDEELRALLPSLRSCLAEDADDSGWRLDWLAG